MHECIIQCHSMEPTQSILCGFLPIIIFVSNNAPGFADLSINQWIVTCIEHSINFIVQLHVF